MHLIFEFEVGGSIIFEIIVDALVLKYVVSNLTISWGGETFF